MSSVETKQASTKQWIPLVHLVLNIKHEMVLVASEVGMTSMQVITLLMLDTHEEHSMNYFGRLYDCDASNVTGIIDGLESKDLVKRANHPTDRRIKVIHMTPCGMAMKQVITERLAQTEAAMFGRLSKADAHELHRLLALLSTD